MVCFAFKTAVIPHDHEFGEFKPNKKVRIDFYCLPPLIV